MNTNNELGWKPDIPESYEDGEPAAYEAGFSNGYFYNKNHGIGGIVWHSISEGHLPAISSKYNNRSEMVLVWGKDGWVQINYYNHEIGNWFSTDFPFVITHFAYINYPEPENSVKEQSS